MWPRDASRARGCSTSAAARSRTRRSSPETSPSTSASTSPTPRRSWREPSRRFPYRTGPSISCSARRRSSTQTTPRVRCASYDASSRRAAAYSRPLTACRSTTRTPTTSGAGHTQDSNGSSGKMARGATFSSLRRPEPRPASECSLPHTSTSLPSAPVCARSAHL